MLQNYIKIVLRNLWKNKTFSALTIGGLSLSMAVCLLFIMLIKGAHEFDNFHPEGDRVYRILTDAQRKGGGSERYATSPYTVAAGLVEGYALVESWVPLCSALNGEVKQGENMLPLQGLFATPSFFETFGFALEQGDPATALAIVVGEHHEDGGPRALDRQFEPQPQVATEADLVARWAPVKEVGRHWLTGHDFPIYPV